MKRLILSLFLIIFFELAHAETISFSDLQNLTAAEHVQIRGFLYETDDKNLILTSMPNLKSCCIGKLDYQIHVFGLTETPSLKNAITLEGELSILNDFEIKYYRLDNAVLVPDKKSSFFITLLTVIIALIILKAIIKIFFGKQTCILL